MFESSTSSEEMNCKARGNPSTVTYTWYRQNVEIKSNTNNLIIENGGARLRFVKPTREMATTYSCSGRNIYGPGDRKGAKLIVNCNYLIFTIVFVLLFCVLYLLLVFLNLFCNFIFPMYFNFITIILSSLDIPEPVEFPDLLNKEASVNQDTNVTIKCYSDAVPAATYSWFRRYKDLRGQVREEKLGDDNQSGELTLYNVKVNDTGDYKCLAFNRPDPKLPNSMYTKHSEMKLKVLCE